MSKGPIKFSDFYDDDVQQGLEQLRKLFNEIKVTATAMRSAVVAEGVRAAKQVAGLRDELQKMQKRLRETDVTAEGAGKSLAGMAAHVSGLTNKHREAKETVIALDAIIDVHIMGLKECKETVRALEKEYSELNGETEESRKRQEALLKKIAEVSKQFNKLNGDLRKSKRALEEIDGTYSALSRETQRLKDELQNLPDAFDKVTGAINKNNKEAVELQQQIKQNTDALKKMDAQMGMHFRNVGNYGSALTKLGGIGKNLATLFLGAFGLDSLSGAIRKIYDTTMQLDTLNTVMKYTSGTEKEFERNMNFLRDVTERLGLEFMSTSKAFRLWTGAAKESNLTQAETREIFESVAKAASTMKMSAEDTEGVFLALSQMLSKGKIQAEELRGQLGERLPGAFALAARAIGKTETELNKMLEQGQVIAEDFLPKFAKELDSTFGAATTGKVESLQGSTNRLSNSFTRLVGNARLQNYFMDAIDGVTGLTDAFGDLIAVKPAEELEKEKVALIGMRIELDSTTTSATRRQQIIEDLKRSYPAYLSQIDAEKATNTELLPILDRINEAYVLRIAYQERATKLDEAVKNEAEAINDAYDNQQKLIGQIARIQNELGKDGIRFEIQGNDERERATYIYRNLLSTIRENAKENRELNQVLASNKYDQLVAGLNAYNNDLINSNRLLNENRKERKLAEEDLTKFRDTAGMKDGTNEDPLTQQYNLQQTMLRIQNSTLEQMQKNQIAHQVAMAGSTADAQAEAIAEVERLERLRALALSQGLVDEDELRKKALEKAKKARQDALKAISDAEQIELLILQNSFAKKEITEQQHEEKRLAIRKKAIDDRIRILKASPEADDRRQAELLMRQKETLDIEYAAWKKAFEEKQLQDRYEIELANLNRIYGEGRIKEAEYQQQRTNILATELERRAQLEADAVKRAQLLAQAAQVRKDGSKRYGQEMVRTGETWVGRMYQLDQGLLDSREVGGEDVRAERLRLESEMLGRLKALYEMYGHDVTEINHEIALLSIASDTLAAEKRMENIERIRSAMMENADIIRDYLGDGWGDLFSTLTDQLMEFVEKGKIGFENLGEAIEFYGAMAKSVGTIIYENAIADSQKRIEVLEAEKARIIEIETSGIEDKAQAEAAKKRIEDEYNARIKAEKVKMARAERDHALFSIAINTAMAVTMALAQLGPIAGIVMAAIVGGLGIAQAALVMSKPLPQYWTGTAYSREGYAELAERGPELVEKNGQRKLVEKRSVMWLDRGSRVYTASQTTRMLEAERLQRQTGVNSTLAGELPRWKQRYDVETAAAAFAASRIDERKIGDAVGSHIRDMPVSNWSVDERGFTRRIRKGNTTSSYLNKRFSL